MPPIEVSRPLLLGLLAVGAVVAVATPQPTSSFGAGFVAGVGTVFVLSFLKARRPEPGAGENGGDRS
ncbi:MAG: hypothetical protein ACM3NW_05905 [Syntrophomonadaceae bacterium]